MLSFGEMMKQAAVQQQRAKNEINYLKAKQQEIEAQKKRELVQMHKSNTSKPMKPSMKNNNKEPPTSSEFFKTFKIPKKVDPDALKKEEKDSPKPSTSKSINNHGISKPVNKGSAAPSTLLVKKSSIPDKNVNPDRKVVKNITPTPGTGKKLKNKEEPDGQRQKVKKDIPKKSESLKPSSTPAVSCFDNDLLGLLNEAKHVSKAPPPKVPPPKPTLPKPVVSMTVPKKVDVSKNSANLKGKKVFDVAVGKKRLSDNFTGQPPYKKPVSYEEMMKLASENAKKLQSGEPLVPTTTTLWPPKGASRP